MLLSVVGKYIVLSWRIFLAHFASAVSFRASFFLHLFAIIIFFGGQFFLWIMFFKQFPLIGGWTVNDVILAYSLYLFSLSILDVFAGGIIDLTEIINSGALDYYMTFPKPILWHIAVSKSDVMAMSTIGLSLIFFITVCQSFMQFILFLCAACFSIILLFNFFVVTQSIAFFIGGFDRGASAVRHLLGIVSPYPFSIFTSPFKYVLMTLFPVFFVVTIPARLINNFSVYSVIILTIVCIISSYIARIVFNAGLRRYESGNMVNVRV